MVTRKPTVKIITPSDWSTMPWAGLSKTIMEEQSVALATAREALESGYQEQIYRYEQAHSSAEAPFEGNASEVLTRPELSVEQIMHVRVKASEPVLIDFFNNYGIAPSTAPTMLSQVLKRISDLRLTTVSGGDYTPETNDLISAKALVKQIYSDPQLTGLYHWLMMDTRSTYLEKQYVAPARSYCSLVPLIMNAFKVHKDVPYSHWFRDEIIFVVNPKLASAMLCDLAPPDREAILSARAEGLKVKSGAKVGTVRNPTHTFKLYGKNGLSEFPELAQVMLAQIWCAHPTNRTRFMVLDYLNWDRVPPALVDTEVTISLPAASNTTKVNDLPWLN